MHHIPQTGVCDRRKDVAMKFVRFMEAVMLLILTVSFSAADGDFWQEALLISFFCLIVLGLCVIREYIEERYGSEA